MRNVLVAFLLATLLALGAGAAKAQEASTDSPPSQPQVAMPRTVQSAYTAGSRSADGEPGANYWQNSAVHDIKVTVAPPSRTISATEEIVYTNNSQDYLDRLPIRLYMNVRLPEAQREEPHTADFLTSGVHIDELRIDGKVVPWQPLGGSPTTAPIIGLPLPLAPGESVKLGFDWHYDLATEAKHEGAIDPSTFFVGYWFPRVPPNNDYDPGAAIPNFDTEEFTYRSGREQFNDFADFNVEVTVPKNFIVWATGELQNPEEVLQPEYAQRLVDSMTSDTTVNIAQPEEIQAGKVTTQTDMVTWKWKADNVPDMAFGLSDHYVWDAGSVVVDPETERRASVQVAYPIEATEYISMVEDAKSALSFGSTQWPGVPYPYPKTTVFVGGADEEYPMMANDSATAPPLPGATVRFVAAHELLHSWFPFFMGIDERRYPMLDEGWTTAFEYLYNLQDVGKAQADLIFKMARSGNLLAEDPGIDLPILTPADRLRGHIAGINAYEKPALAYLALKDLMGDDAFKASLHEFITRWNGKHPLPWDLFNTFNATSETDLTWFFTNWFAEPNYIDLAISAVTPAEGDAEVTVENLGGFAVPFDLLVQYKDGAVVSQHVTPAVWEETPLSTTLTITDAQNADLVAADTGIFMDVDQNNNLWPARPAADPRAPFTATVKSDDPAASIAMTLLPKSKANNPTQFGMPNGVIVQVTVSSPLSTPVELLKSGAATVKLVPTDDQFVDGGEIGGYPSQALHAALDFGGTAYSYDGYAFTTPAATYSIQFLVPTAAAGERFRTSVYPEILKSVTVDPQ